MKSHHVAGFTFIEVVTASFMLTVVVVVGATFWHFTRQNYEFSMTHYRLTENTTRAVRIMSQEIREAQDAMDGAYPLERLLEHDIIFYSDVTNDRRIDRLHYWVTNNTLYRGIIQPTGDPPTYDAAHETVTIISDQIAATHEPFFSYYNGDWPGDIINNPLATASRVLNTRMVKIRIPLSIQDTSGINTYVVENIVHIRNLKDNL